MTLFASVRGVFYVSMSVESIFGAGAAAAGALTVAKAVGVVAVNDDGMHQAVLEAAEGEGDSDAEEGKKRRQARRTTAGQGVGAAWREELREAGAGTPPVSPERVPPRPRLREHAQLRRSEPDSPSLRLPAAGVGFDDFQVHDQQEEDLPRSGRDQRNLPSDITAGSAFGHCACASDPVAKFGKAMGELQVLWVQLYVYRGIRRHIGIHRLALNNCLGRLATETREGHSGDQMTCG